MELYIFTVLLSFQMVSVLYLWRPFGEVVSFCKQAFFMGFPIHSSQSRNGTSERMWDLSIHAYIKKSKQTLKLRQSEWQRLLSWKHFSFCLIEASLCAPGVLTEHFPEWGPASGRSDFQGLHMFNPPHSSSVVGSTWIYAIRYMEKSCNCLLFKQKCYFYLLKWLNYISKYCSTLYRYMSCQYCKKASLDNWSSVTFEFVSLKY